MHFSELLALLPDESDSALSDVCKRQTRIIRLFCRDEAECRANAGAFYGFAARCAAWATERDASEQADVKTLLPFIDAWIAFRIK